MDNLCHSLVGAAMSAAGLRRRTRFATPTLVIGANLPDVDVLVYLFGDGTSALAFRRGWTHGVLAMVVLPVALAAVMLGADKLMAARRRPAPPSAGQPSTVASQLLLLAAASIWSHPLLDLLNTYGVRLLMPFSDRWFYGDTLFIVDPWLWLALGVGSAISLRRARRVGREGPRAGTAARAERPARIALAAVGVYVLVMAASSAIGRGVVERLADGSGLQRARRIMVAPEAVTPLERSVVRDLGDRYEIGRLSWVPRPTYRPTGDALDSQMDAPAVRAASLTRPARDFLYWSRFPFARADSAGDVLFDDVRYGMPGRPSFAATHARDDSASGAAPASR